MKMAKRLLALVLTVMLISTLAGCGNKDEKTEQKKEKVVIAYQASVAYAPLIVMKEQKLLEKAYGDDIEVEYKVMDNGAAINDGITAGNIDVGAMGVSPAVTGVMAGVPYKIAFGLSAQPYAILTNQKNIKTLKDIKKNTKIAITQVNSQPHVLLGMACKEVLGDAHALDNNLEKLANPDGYSAMVSGAIDCHMVISPFNFMEENSKEKAIHEIEVPEGIWENGDTFIVGMVSESLKKDKPKVYDALCKSVEDAIKYINANPKNTAEMLSSGYDESVEDIQEWITDERSVYSTKLQNVMKGVKFMVNEKFIDKGPSKLSEIAYDNVKGN